MAVNVRSVVLGCKHAIPRMIEAGGGSIVNMSSGSAKFGDFVRTAYGSSKAAINTLTKYVATQHGRDVCGSNAIAPGLVLTPPAFANLTPEHRRPPREQPAHPVRGGAGRRGAHGALPRVRRVALRDRPGVAGERRPVGAPADVRPAARGPAALDRSGSGTVCAGHDGTTSDGHADTTRRGHHGHAERHRDHRHDDQLPARRHEGALLLHHQADEGRAVEGRVRVPRRVHVQGRARQGLPRRRRPDLGHAARDGPVGDREGPDRRG